jgi:hypothetical protein
MTEGHGADGSYLRLFSGKIWCDFHNGPAPQERAEILVFRRRGNPFDTYEKFMCFECRCDAGRAKRPPPPWFFKRKGSAKPEEWTLGSFGVFG